MKGRRLVREESIRDQSSETFQEHKERITRFLPHADVQHVGGTSVPGALTKGDIDLGVRVLHGAFDEAVQTLRSSYAIHQPDNWTRTYASFKEEEPNEIPVGVQLTVKNSPDDFFVATRDLLRNDPDLLAEYNALKSTHAADDDETYLAAKSTFMERLLSERLHSGKG